MDLRSLKDVRVDHLGSVGTKLILKKVGVGPPDEVFIRRASTTFPRGPSGDFSRRRSSAPQLDENTPQQRRIFAYAEYSFERIGKGEDISAQTPVEGRMLREHGFQGLRMWQKGWLKAVVLPVNPNVDRSVCAEFQVFNELCDLVHQTGLADSKEECQGVVGHVQFLVSTTPCLSCVCAVMQYQLLFPRVCLEFGCVQPWHSEGGADGAMREPAWTGIQEKSIRPAMWEGGRVVTLGERPPEEIRSMDELPLEVEEPLTAEEFQALRSACQTRHGRLLLGAIEESQVKSWSDLKAVLMQCSIADLAEVLRCHKVSVQPDILPDRVKKVVLVLRRVLGKGEIAEPVSSAVGAHRSLNGKRPQRRPASVQPVRWLTNR